jgi:hypothetical protein
MTLRQGSAFMKVAALLPRHLPDSTPRVPSGPFCYEVAFTVLFSDGSKRLYGPCMHPSSIVPALRTACLIYILSPDNRGPIALAAAKPGCDFLR